MSLLHDLDLQSGMMLLKLLLHNVENVLETLLVTLDCKCCMLLLQNTQILCMTAGPVFARLDCSTAISSTFNSTESQSCNFFLVHFTGGHLSGGAAMAVHLRSNPGMGYGI